MMKKIFLIAAIGFSAFTVAAQDIPRRQNDGVQRTAPLRQMEGMNFTDAQKAELKNLRQAGRETAEAINNNTALSEEQKKQALQQLHTRQRDKMQGILTPEQKERLKAYNRNGNFNREDNKPDTRPGSGRRRDMPKENGTDWKTALQLTDGQQRKLEALRLENKSEIDAIKADTRISPERKQMMIQRFMYRQKEKRDAILSPIQQAKWDAHYRTKKYSSEHRLQQGAHPYQQEYNYN